MAEKEKNISRILSMTETIVAFLTRRKLLYKLVGWVAAVSLISELEVFDLESKFQIDYQGLSFKYGELTAAAIAWVVDVFAGGYDLASVIIKTLILTFCLYIDFKVQTKDGKKKTIWNIFFGIKQEINQNYDMRDDE